VRCPQNDLSPNRSDTSLHLPLISVKDLALKADFVLMGYARQRTRLGLRRRSIDGDEGIDFVRCRICGDHRRVISGRHLSKHDTDRETYMEEYDLSPDELIAKAFRIIQSSRRGYHPYGKRDWINAVKKIHKQGESVFAGDLQDKYPHLYRQGVWIFGDWDKALRAAGFDPERMRIRRFWDQETIIKKYALCEIRIYPSIPTT